MSRTSIATQAPGTRHNAAAGATLRRVDMMNKAKHKTMIEGVCHCGNLGFSFATTYTRATLPIRACQCSFCRMHGAATARDPDGRAAIKARDPHAVTLYRFGTRSTDFILCAHCGAYLGAVITHEAARYATLNLRLTSLELERAVPVVYDDEPVAQRIRRRIESFTPVGEYYV